MATLTWLPSSNLLIEDPSSFPADQQPRVGLYRCFLKVWNSVALNNVPASDLKSRADHSLEAITPRARQAFLLASLEGFTTSQTADDPRLQQG